MPDWLETPLICGLIPAQSIASDMHRQNSEYTLEGAVLNCITQQCAYSFFIWIVLTQ